MKRILLCIALFISTQLFAFDPFDEGNEVDKLTSDISTFIVNTDKEIRKTGYFLDGMCWIAAYRIEYGFRTRYKADLVKGEHYYLFTMTTGEPVKVFIVNDNNPTVALNTMQGSKIIFKFIAPATGSYHYHVECLTQDKSLPWCKGLYRSYFTVRKLKILEGLDD